MSNANNQNLMFTNCHARNGNYDDVLVYRSHSIQNIFLSICVHTVGYVVVCKVYLRQKKDQITVAAG